MKNFLATASLVTSVLLAGCASVNTAHTPPDGSTEKNAIVQATQRALARQGRKHLQHYESQSGLLHEKATNKWTLLEWMPVEQGTDYTKYFKNLKAKYPLAPGDIFPQ